MNLTHQKLNVMSSFWTKEEFFLPLKEASQLPAQYENFPLVKLSISWNFCQQFYKVEDIFSFNKY